MNRAYLKGLGLESETIDQIMAEYGRNVEGLNAQIATLTTEASTLREAAKPFEGVDLEALKKAPADVKAEYEQKIKDMQIDSAIQSALIRAKVKHADLLSNKFDRSKITIDKDGKIQGVDEQITGFKESYKDLFVPAVSGGDPDNPEGASGEAAFDFGFTPLRGVKNV